MFYLAYCSGQSDSTFQTAHLAGGSIKTTTLKVNLDYIFGISDISLYAIIFQDCL